VAAELEYYKAVGARPKIAQACGHFPDVKTTATNGRQGARYVTLICPLTGDACIYMSDENTCPEGVDYEDLHAPTTNLASEFFKNIPR